MLLSERNPGISFQQAALNCIVGGEGREKFKGTLSLFMGQTCGCSSRFEPSHEIVGQGHVVLSMKPYLGLSKKDVDKMYEFFLRIDLDEDHQLHIQELIVGARLDNFRGVEFIESIFLLYDGQSDTVGTGRLNFYEFILALYSFLTSSKEDLVRLCFALIDLDNSKVITIDELKFMLTIIWGDKPHKKVGYNRARNARPIVSLDSRVLNALKSFDIDNSGDITLDEFVAFNNQVPIVMLPLINLQRELRGKVLGNWRWKSLQSRRDLILHKRNASTGMWHPYRTKMIEYMTPPNSYGYSLSFMTELLRRSSNRSSIPTSIDKRVDSNLSGKKRFSPGDLNDFDSDTDISDIDVEIRKEHQDSRPKNYSKGAGTKRGQVMNCHPERSDSAKRIQKIVRGKQGRDKATAIRKQCKQSNNRGGGKVQQKTSKNDNNNGDKKYIGIHKEKKREKDSAETIQKFLRQTSDKRRRRRQEAAGTLTLGALG